MPETTRHIAIYSVLMVCLTLAFFAVARMGLVFLAGTVVLGTLFLRIDFAVLAGALAGMAASRSTTCAALTASVALR